MHVVLDPALHARIVSRQALRYTTATDPSLQRPDHVRAASGIAWLGDRLLIIQDDASFIATFDEQTGATDVIVLPPGPDGARTFDVERGNKGHKLDLEACTTVMRDGVPTLLALASGSSSARESIVCVQAAARGYTVEVIRAERLYAALRTQPGFATSELNLEGAVGFSDRVRLFQRSNGLPIGEHKTCATCDLDWVQLDTFLRDPDSAPVPSIANVHPTDLGTIDNIDLTFTDATLLRDSTVLFLASAEGSPNAVDDGAVMGTVIGIMDAEGHARMCHLRDERGALVTAKAEGIALSRTHAGQALVVFDPDDHRIPATLARVELRGF